jgi:hypothetical protein
MQKGIVKRSLQQSGSSHPIKDDPELSKEPLLILWREPVNRKG